MTIHQGADIHVEPITEEAEDNYVFKPFKLDKQPFSINPDPELYCQLPSHEESFRNRHVVH